MTMTQQKRAATMALAAATALGTRADRLCRIIESAHRDNPDLARAAEEILRDDANHAKRALDEVGQHNDSDVKYLAQQAREAVQMSERRRANSVAWDPPAEGPNGRYLKGCAELVAATGQMEHHAREATKSPNDTARRAHTGIATALIETAQARTEAIARMPESLRDDAADDALRLANEAQQRMFEAFISMVRERRQTMPVIIDARVQADERDLNELAMEYAASDRPVDIRIATGGRGGPEMVLLLYEDPMDDVIRVTLAGLNYPPGTPAETALEHAGFLEDYARYHLTEGPTGNEARGERLAVVAQSVRMMAATGIHTLEIGELADRLRQRAKMGQIGRATVRRMLGATDAGPHIAEITAERAGTSQITTPAQAQAIINAGLDAGAAEDAMAEVAALLGVDPANHGIARKLLDDETLTAISDDIMEAGGSAEVTMQMLQATGCGPERAAIIAEQVARKRGEAETGETGPSREMRLLLGEEPEGVRTSGLILP